MVSIIKFLPRETQERVEREASTFEKTFRLKPGTVEQVAEKKARSRPSRKVSTPSTPTPSASTLTGTAEQREQQIQQFREPTPSRTLVSQARERQIPTATISAFRPEDFQTEPPRISLREGVSSFGRKVAEFDFPLAVRQSLTGEENLGRLSDPFTAFSFVGPTKGEAVVRFEPQFGTVTSDIPKGVKEITRSDIQRERELKAGVPSALIGFSPRFVAQQLGREEAGRIQTKFQRLVDVGKLDVPTATKQAEAELGTSFKQITSSLSDLPQEDLRERVGKGTAQKTKQVGKAAIIIGGSIISPTFASAVAATSLAAGGQLTVRAGEEFGRGEIKKGTSSLLQGSLLIGSGAALIGSTLGPSGTIPSSITRGRIQELQRTPISFDAAEIARSRTGDISVLKISGSRTTGLASEDILLRSPIIKTGVSPSGKDLFSIVGGRGQRALSVVPFNQPTSLLKSSQIFTFTARGKAGLGSAISRPGFTQLLPKDVSGSLGRLDIVSDGNIRRIGFGGIGRKSGDDILVSSGRIIGVTDRGTAVIKPEAAGRIIPLKGDIAFPKTQAQILDLKGFDFGTQALRGRPTTSQISLKAIREQLTFGGTAGVKAAQVISQSPIKITGPSTSTIVTSSAAPSLFFGGRGGQIGSFVEPTLGPLSFQPLSVSPRTRPTLLEPKPSKFIPSTIQRGAVTIGVSTRQPQRLDPGTQFKQPVIFDTRPIIDTRPIQTPRMGLIEGFKQPTPQEFAGGGLSSFAPSAIAAGGFAFSTAGFLFPPLGPLPTLGKSRAGLAGIGLPSTRISPSLTGIGLQQLGDITGDLPIDIGIGILPGQTRFAPKRKKVKKKKKK